MILIKCNKDGKITELYGEGGYLFLLNKLNEITEEEESNGILLIKEVVSDRPMAGISREFATIKDGWECVYAIAGGWVNSISHRNSNKDNDEGLED